MDDAGPTSRLRPMDTDAPTQPLRVVAPEASTGRRLPPPAGRPRHGRPDDTGSGRSRPAPAGGSRHRAPESDDHGVDPGPEFHDGEPPTRKLSGIAIPGPIGLASTPGMTPAGPGSYPGMPPAGPGSPPAVSPSGPGSAGRSPAGPGSAAGMSPVGPGSAAGMAPAGPGPAAGMAAAPRPGRPGPPPGPVQGGPPPRPGGPPPDRSGAEDTVAVRGDALSGPTTAVHRGDADATVAVKRADVGSPAEPEEPFVDADPYADPRDAGYRAARDRERADGGSYDGDSYDRDSYDGGSYDGGPVDGGPFDRDAARDADGADRDADARPDEPEPSRGRRTTSSKRAAKPRRGRRTGVFLVAVGFLLVVLAGGGYYLYDQFLSTPDYDGGGSGDVVITVADGDSTAAIGRAMREADVVASVDAFLRAAAQEDSVRGVQPGSYLMRRQMSGAAAVERLLDPSARVGQLDIRGGVQIDDTSAPNAPVAPGVLSLISRASCATIDGTETCVSVDDLRAAMVQTDPAELGVPAWALDEVAAAEPNRRLEGLLAPGLYEIGPGQSALQVLQGLLATSVARLEEAGLVSGSEAVGADPYDTLILASLVEKEGITPDMPRVSQVLHNRLEAQPPMRLELDSMVNYPLDVQAVRTTPEARATPGPYNSYRNTGLPPTPIAAAGNPAIDAALNPEPGPWLFFVRCYPDGVSCFAETYPEHQQNVADAQERGAY